MVRNSLILFIILFSYTGWCFSQYSSDDEKLRQIVAEKGQAEIIIPNPGQDIIEKLTRTVSIRSVNEKTVNIVLSPLTVEWFILQQYHYEIIERDETKGIIISGTVSQAMNWESYPSYTQYDSIMKSFASSYPTLCRLDTIGTSINGRLILALKISDNCRINEPEPEVFYTSTIHGDETAGFVLMLHFADYLLKNYNADFKVQNLVDNLEIWINPLANPDGTYRGGNYIDSPVRHNANGYDLNRNFPDPLTPNTAQQKETLEMIKFMKSHRFVISANFHSGVEVVNFPWDRWSRKHADDSWFYSVSRAWADTVHMYSRAGYMDFLDNGVTNGYNWYPVYGGRQDYTTYSLSGREVTIELDTNYITPAADLADLWEFNHRSMLNYLENALFGIQGHISDSFNDKPVKALVFIKDHDKDNSHIYSDSLSGSFSRYLVPGLYNLTFSANGYRDTTIKNINVLPNDATYLNVRINPDLNPADTIKPDNPVFYPNPCSSYTKVVLPVNIRGSVNIRIYGLNGLKIIDYNTEAPERYPVLIDVSCLKPGTYFVVFKNLSNNISCRGSIVVKGTF